MKTFSEFILWWRQYDVNQLKTGYNFEMEMCQNFFTIIAIYLQEINAFGLYVLVRMADKQTNTKRTSFFSPINVLNLMSLQIFPLVFFN